MDGRTDGHTNNQPNNCMEYMEYMEYVRIISRNVDHGLCINMCVRVSNLFDCEYQELIHMGGTMVRLCPHHQNDGGFGKMTEGDDNDCEDGCADLGGDM